MKITDIVRRVDDLGRIVIPRDIRRQLKINEGELMEILIDEDMVIFKKVQSDGKKLDTQSNI